jgi:hypothetical protein
MRAKETLSLVQTKKKRFSFQGGNYNAITTARAERGDGIPQTESPPTVALAVYYVLRRNAPKLGSYYTTACVLTTTSNLGTRVPADKSVPPNLLAVAIAIRLDDSAALETV